MSVRAKKHLGQHFLKDESVSQRIAEAIADGIEVDRVLEIGPGMGALTKFLLNYSDFDTYVIEIDSESVEYLHENYPALNSKIYERDFLREDLHQMFGGKPFAVVGNFPYNISSQILFKVYENKELVPLVVGMFQKEVAERIAEKPGSKKYGILSVLLQAFYDIEYLFTVDEDVFIPPPKVKSGVIRLKRNSTEKLACDEDLFKKVVKAAFNQRRKTLRNSLKQLANGMNPGFDFSDEIFGKRPEQLGVDDFVSITQRLIV